MSGALIDLVAKGVQDAYLTGQPEVSFFRQNYKRHTNFAMKTIRLNPMGNNTDHTLKIPTKGDLLNYIWIDLDTFDTSNAAIAADSTNSATFELWIGGQMIDRQDAFYMTQLWHKFLLDSGAKGMATQYDSDDSTVRSHVLEARWMPLHFFFCDNYSLPMLCLQYNEVEIRITYKQADAVPNFKYYASYTVLDTDERDWFVNNTHELLIEQVQKLDSEGSGTSKRFDLNLLNHPVKCLMWSNVSTSNSFTSQDVQIYLNGTELFGIPLPDKFFTQVQGYYHSEHASELLKGGSGAGGSGLKMYSFAMKASKHQPTGTCNFSRLDNAHMILTNGSSDDGDLNLYAVNFNILRIKQGMAGLAFSN